MNCGVGEDSRESLGLQGDQTSQSQRKSMLNIHWIQIQVQNPVNKKNPVHLKKFFIEV